MYDIAGLNILDGSEMTYENAAALFVSEAEQIGMSVICYRKKSFYQNIDVKAITENDSKISAAYYPYMFDFSSRININDEYPAQCQQLKRYWHLPRIKNQIEYLGQNTLR